MRGLKQNYDVVLVALMLALAAMLGACDTDSPTEPTQTPNQPAPTTATTAFAISVGVSPTSMVSGDGTVIDVTVIARRTDTNAFVPRGSTALLSTTSGTLTNEAGSSTGATVSLSFGLNGTARATLAGATSTATVRAQIEQSTGQATVQVSEPAAVVPFTLIQAVPNFGPPTGGTTVRIEGTGFSAPAEVSFGGINVPIESISGSVIQVKSPQIELPSGTNQSVSIIVSVNVGEEGAATGSLGNAFTYTRNATPTIPKIISVTPTSGPNEGGTRVTIFGEAFGSEVQVFFGAGSLIEAEILSLSPTRIIVNTPPATGQNSGSQNSVVAVRVRDLRSGFEATLPSAFQYGGGDMLITAISPDEGVYFGGDLVTIFGTGGFEAPVTVAFGGEGQNVVSVSGTEIVARSVPVEINNCARPSGAASVVNVETGETFSGGPVFTYRPVEPVIGSLSVTSTTVDVDTGAVLGPDETIITGRAFDRQSNPPNVAFGAELSPSVEVTSLDPDPFFGDNGVGDVLRVEIPPFLGDFATESCVSGGSSGERFVEERVDVTVTARDTGCSDTLSGGFTYFPNDTSCRVVPTSALSVACISGTNNVTVTDTSFNGHTGVNIDFGNGALCPDVVNGTPGGTFPCSYPDGGPYTITLTAFNASFVADPATFNVAVIPCP